MFAKRWNTATSTNGDVVVTVEGFEASVKATVTRGGKHVAPSVSFRKRDDRGGREPQFTKEVLTTAEWPAAGPDEEEKWSKFLEAALTRMGNPSHSMTAAHECSTQWRGSLDMDALRKDGFVGATAVVQPSDAEILEAWGAELADEAGASTVHHLQGESGAHSVFVLPETWKEETLAEYGGQLARGWEVAPQRWVPRKVAVRRALAAAQPHMVVAGTRGTEEPAFDVSGALGRAAEALRVGCGKAAGGIKPLLEILIADEARLLKPQPWHADLLSIASLGAIAMLSERGVPPYFPAICKDWGDGRGVIASASEGSGKRKGRSQVQEVSYYAARKMRWDRVYASGRNDGESVAATNVCGGALGTTTEGYASAGPRRQLRTGPGPVRAATGPRPTQVRGDVTYFDTTGPHRGPGKALGDPAGRRVVLYCSWAKGAWEREGSPAYAFRLPGVPRAGYQLVYDAKGKYMMTESAPSNTQAANAKGAAKRRATLAAKQAAEALAGMVAE